MAFHSEVRTRFCLRSRLFSALLFGSLFSLGSMIIEILRGINLYALICDSSSKRRILGWRSAVPQTKKGVIKGLKGMKGVEEIHYVTKKGRWKERRCF